MSGAASVGGGRSKGKGAGGAQADKGTPRSVTPPPPLSAPGDTANVRVPNPRLTRGISSDAVLSSPSRDQSEALVARLMSAPRGGSAGGKGTAGKGGSFNAERPRRFSLGKASSFLRSEPVAGGGDTIKPSSPARAAGRAVKGAVGRGAEGLAAAASAEAAIALIGTGEPRQGKSEWGKADAAGHADAVRAALNAADTIIRSSDVETDVGGSAEAGLEPSVASEESVLEKSSAPTERVSAETKGDNDGGEGGGSGSGSGEEQGGVSNQTKVVVEDVVIDPRDLTFFYSSGHASRPRNDTAARRTVAAARKVG